jgi:hypothetical protein
MYAAMAPAIATSTALEIDVMNIYVFADAIASLFATPLSHEILVHYASNLMARGTVAGLKYLVYETKGLPPAIRTVVNRLGNR